MRGFSRLSDFWRPLGRRGWGASVWFALPAPRARLTPTRSGGVRGRGSGGATSLKKLQQYCPCPISVPQGSNCSASPVEGVPNVCWVSQRAGRWTSSATAAVAAERRIKPENTLERSVMGCARSDRTLGCPVPEKSRVEPCSGLGSCNRGAPCGSDSISCARMATTVGEDHKAC